LTDHFGASDLSHWYQLVLKCAARQLLLCSLQEEWIRETVGQGEPGVIPGERGWGGLASWGSVFLHELRHLGVVVLGGFCLGGEVDGPHGLGGCC